MDINPNPGPTFSLTKDFSSLTPMVKQRFNLYKRTATKVTRHEFHLKTYQFYLQKKLIPKGLKPKLHPAIKPISEDFYLKWNYNIDQLGFLQLRLLEEECIKKLISLNKTKADLHSQLLGLCEHETFNRLMNFVSENISYLQSKLQVKYLTKIERGSKSNAHNASAIVHYPTDFPFYIETIPY